MEFDDAWLEQIKKVLNMKIEKEETEQIIDLQPLKPLPTLISVPPPKEKTFEAAEIEENSKLNFY